MCYFLDIIEGWVAHGKAVQRNIKHSFFVLNITLSFVTLGEFMEFFPKSAEAVIVAFTLIPFTLVAFLQFLFIPQIALAVLSILYTVHLIRDKKSGNFKKRDLIQFILLFLWGLTGMYPAWNAFQALQNI